MRGQQLTQDGGGEVSVVASVVACSSVYDGNINPMAM